MHIAAAVEINSRFIPSLEQLHKSLHSKVEILLFRFARILAILLVLCLLYCYYAYPFTDGLGSIYIYKGVPSAKSFVGSG